MHVLSLNAGQPVLNQVRLALDKIADGETLEVVANGSGMLDDGELKRFFERAGVSVSPTDAPERIRISKDVRPAEPVEVLSVENISKTFQRGPRQITYALENVSLSIREGEFVAFVGPSGCGKTTLLNILAGLEYPDNGAAFERGKRITSANPRRVVMFQDAALFPWLTVRQNVEFGLKMRGVPGRVRSEKALKYLQMVHLLKFADNFVHELSGGMRQRTALARALAMEPDVLLMDEPFGALDAQTRDILHEELQSIWIGTHKTMLLVTHSVQEAVRLADRIFVFGARPGRIKKEFRLNLLRPRDPQSPVLDEVERQVLAQLQDEVNKIAQEELDQDWKGMKKKPPPESNFGADI